MFTRKVDLHTHTTASDGMLSPKELITRAVDNEVNTLAITDHDTVLAYSQITTVPETLQIITGCEFSTKIGKYDIHLVALNFNIRDSDIEDVLAQQAEARLDRAEKICKKLQKQSIKIDIPLVRTHCSLTEVDIITSPHIAKTLLNIGEINQLQQAYKRYLGKGKSAYVQPLWVAAHEVIDRVHRAGGIVLLAHPLGYNLTRTKRLTLIHDFMELNGDGIEIVSGYQSVANTAELIMLCDEHNLVASVGSDFHAPYPYRHDVGINVTQLEKTFPQLTNIKTSWSSLFID